MRPVRRAAVLALTLFIGLCAQAQLAFTLADLLAMTARQTRVQATFSEKKFIRGLDGANESSGELSFDAPDHMVKRTLLPKPETLKLDARQVTLERGRQVRSLSLDDYPELAVHVEGVRACLAGDKADLERVYRAELTGTAVQWKLVLTPLNDRAAALVKAVVLSGEQADIRGVQVLLTDGDSSVMRIAQPSRP